MRGYIHGYNDYILILFETTFLILNTITFMKHVLDNPRQFRSIADPYNQDRICFSCAFLYRMDMILIAEDTKFLFYSNEVLYFDK